jgi:hypothetical protein
MRIRGEPRDARDNELERTVLLTRLFGGRSLRHQTPETISGLLQRDLIDDEGKLTVPGLHLFIGAVREQQAMPADVRETRNPRSTSAHHTALAQYRPPVPVNIGIAARATASARSSAADPRAGELNAFVDAFA